MRLTITKLTGADAIGVGDAVLAHADGVAVPPAGVAADDPYVALFSSLLARARAAQANLVVAVAAVTTSDADHEEQVDLARAEEKDLDADCAAMHSRLAAEIKGRTPGAQGLSDRLFPSGLVPATRPKGRAQVAVYRPLVQVLSSAADASSSAYAAIADKVGPFSARVDAFALRLQEKSRLHAALTAARAARDKAQAEWTAHFRGLLEAGARIHGEDSDTFRGWIRPILDWKANEEASRTRRANAAEAPTSAETPAETPTDDGESQGG